MNELFAGIHQDMKSGASQRLHTGLVPLFKTLSSIPTDLPAVWHPLGFIYAKLHCEGFTTARLHIWPPGPPRFQVTTSPIHCHSWLLDSYIICGTIENHLIKPHCDTRNPSHRVFEVIYSNSGDENWLKPTDETVSIETYSIQSYSAGQRYRMDPGVFHFTDVPSDRVSATLVLADEIPTTPTQSLGPLDLTEHKVTRNKCEPSELMEAAKLVLTELERASHVPPSRIKELH